MKLRKEIKIAVMLLCIAVNATAQSVGIGTATPDASAMLEIKSINKGLLIPRTSTSSRIAIVNPAKGLMVYDTTINSFWYYNGASWGVVGSAGGASSWAANGSDIYSTNAGNVGIGTTAPIGKLDIRAASSYTSPALTIYDTGPLEYAKIQLQNASGANFWQIDALTNNTDLFNERFLIHNSRLGNIVSVTGDGNVGIGPNNLFPGATLDVARGTAAWGTAAFRGTNTFSYFNYGTTEHTYIRGGKTSAKVYLNDNHNGDVVIAKGGGSVAIGREIAIAALDVEKSALGNATAVFRGSQNACIINAISSEDTYIRGGKSTSNVIIADLGASVGIGTATPDAAFKLSVNGVIRSKEVIVQSGWADYVFDKNYPLTPLNEVEDFINEHRHLANIPSADEIEKNGLQVGDVQKKMMAKIEELTLYIIALEKKVNNLEATQKQAGHE